MAAARDNKLPSTNRAKADRAQRANQDDADRVRPRKRRIFHTRLTLTLFILASIIVALLLTEIGVRLLDVGPKGYTRHRFEPDNRVPFARLANGLIVYQPDVRFASIYDPAGDSRGYFGAEGRVTYGINNRGMRGPSVAIPKPADTYRVVCLGDSFTFGEGVHYKDTWPVRLQGILQENLQEAPQASQDGRSVECVNAGVQAYGTREAVQFFLLRCLPLEPDVVVLGFFLNDATDFQETIRQNEAQTKDAPLSTLAGVSRICEIVERSNRAKALRKDYFQTTRRSFQSEQWAQCRDLLKGMQQLAHDQGFRFVVMLFPILWELDGDYPFRDIHEQIAEACRDAGCECIDLLKTYRGRPTETLWVHPTDHHPNELAHRLAANRLARDISLQK